MLSSAQAITNDVVNSSTVAIIDPVTNQAVASTITDADGNFQSLRVQDNGALAGFLMNDPRVFLFGGFVRHLVNPVVHMEYGDIDVIALDSGVLRALSDRFGFAFTDVSASSTSYPRYFIGRSTRASQVSVASYGWAMPFSLPMRPPFSHESLMSRKVQLLPRISPIPQTPAPISPLSSIMI